MSCQVFCHAGKNYKAGSKLNIMSFLGGGGVANTWRKPSSHPHTGSPTVPAWPADPAGSHVSISLVHVWCCKGQGGRWELQGSSHLCTSVRGRKHPSSSFSMSAFLSLWCHPTCTSNGLQPLFGGQASVPFSLLCLTPAFSSLPGLCLLLGLCLPPCRA